MRFDPDRLLALDIPETVETYGPRECALYALGVGAGMDPLDTNQLAFLRDEDPLVVPTMAVVLGFDGFWVEQQPTGINAAHVLHGEQRLRLLAPLPSTTTIRRKARVTRIVDRGEGRGALVYTLDRIVEQDSGILLAELESTILCRDEGGMGSTHAHALPSPVLPDGAPDGTLALPTSPQQALIYRLSGDRNPLHSDPAFAQAAGFAGPILHGLATYGTACLSLLCTLAEGDPARMTAFEGRFTAPVIPGEPLALDYWQEGTEAVAFRIRATARDAIVMNNGRLVLSN